MQDAPPLCLRCNTVPLVQASDSPESVTFFTCPECHRDYALRDGGRLTFRWMHPISLALYGVQFERNPVRAVDGVAESFRKATDSTTLRAMIREIRLELDEPTQSVREIFLSPATEDDTRVFLRRFCDTLDGSESPADRGSGVRPVSSSKRHSG